MSSVVTVRELGEFAYIVDGLAQPWRWTVEHPDIIETVPARDSLGVYVRAPVVVADYLVAIEQTETPREIVIPVVYDGEDLMELNDRLGLDVAAVHASGTYECQFLGFLPGFPYFGGLPATISGLPRRPSPRAQVPAGSIAIAGDHCGIYPSVSPGGWWLVGRTEVKICDESRDFFLIRPGDRVRFEAVS